MPARCCWGGAAVLALPVPAFAYEVTRSDAEWKKILSPGAYDVLRHEGTEPPGSSPLDREHRKGVFACAGCALDLYSSDTKFDSGTGWPSFWKPLPNAGAHHRGPQPVHAAHRSALPPLRRPSGACVR